MNRQLKADADYIIEKAIAAVKPDAAVKRALEGRVFPGRVYLIAAGKAAYQMAKVAAELVDYEAGIVVTKYHHVMGEIPRVRCFEAGHPVPDVNGFLGTKEALALTADLTAEDTVIFLLSGGGSALFENPLISEEELGSVTNALLKSGADITEMNTIRKRFSAVKGGKFAEHIYPAHVLSIILSDILGDPVDMIASGPTVVDKSTCEEARAIAKKYDLPLTGAMEELLAVETPKTLQNSEALVIGSVRELCKAASLAAEDLGYEVTFLTDGLCCEARDAGTFLGNIATSHQASKKKIAYVLGGETVVHLKGKGLGGRNQEIAVGAAKVIAGLSNVAVFSVGSDGTDGPCDAAGGYADGDTYEAVGRKGLDFMAMQEDNDCYHILEAVDGLIMTGPTGTNVNDFSMILICGGGIVRDKN